MKKIKWINLIKNRKLTNIFINMTQYIVSAIFFMSSMLKFYKPSPFVRLLYELNFSELFSNITLTLIILYEFVISIVLIFKKNIGLKYAFIYMIVITLLLIGLWLSGIDVDCGCFGGFIHSQIGPLKIVQNSTIIIMLFIAMRVSQRPITRRCGTNEKTNIQ